MLSGRALAFVLLAWSLLRVLAGYLRRPAPGLVRFQRNYAADGLAAVDAGERAALPGFSRCIACGRCDLGEDERIAASKGAYPGLMQLVLASTRSMPDFDVAAASFAFVPERELVRKAAACPTGLPLPELARFVRAKALPFSPASSRGQLDRPRPTANG
ncbi:MAG: hypothetical protein HY744_10200 [Deltaproteobacteria bacterium]|nr:hypothetical protein [Deltaproteobacteria bacterium]